MSKVILTSIDDLKSSFLSKKNKPYWTVYSGHNKETKNVFHRHTEGGDMEGSWEELEKEVLKFQKLGGDFTVYVTEKEGLSNGDTLFVRFSNGQSTGTNSNGIQGGFNYGIGGIAEYVDNRLRIAQLERDLEDARNAVPEGISNAGDRILGLIEKSVETDEGAGKLLLSGIFGVANRLVGAIEKIAGVEQPEQTKKNKKAQPKAAQASAAKDDEGEGYDGETLIQACDDLAEIIPDSDPEIVIKNVVDFLKKNPAMIGQFKSMVNG